MPKRADLVHGHRKKVVRPEVAASAPVLPAADGAWLPETTAAWTVYWESELAAVTLDVDLPSIRRLFALYDQHARSMAIVNVALVVKGSTGQLRTNPLADHALKLEGAILRLENELGLTPMARTRLGVRVVRPPSSEVASDPGVSQYGHLRAV